MKLLLLTYLGLVSYSCGSTINNRRVSYDTPETAPTSPPDSENTPAPNDDDSVPTEPPQHFINELPDPLIHSFYRVWLKVPDSRQVDQWVHERAIVELYGCVSTNDSTYPPVVDGITGRNFVMFANWCKTIECEHIHVTIKNAYRFQWYGLGDTNPHASNLWWSEPLDHHPTLESVNSEHLCRTHMN
jgi:hypothetical protein